MEQSEDLIDWAKAQSIKLNGISPHAFPGRGIGLISTRALEEGDTILEVPTTSVKTLETIPASLTKDIPSPPDMTVHGLLALDLALDASTFAEPWRNVLPSREDISTLPLTWPSRLQDLLPPAAGKLLRKQKEKYAKDLAMCRDAVPDLDEDAYLHAWLLVNSRTFYHTSKRTIKLPKEDHLSLQPVADLFNHAARGCTVVFSEASYAIVTDKAYPRGVEIPICYGRHSNDFLLVEYGFILADGTNEWDEASLDDLLLPVLRKPDTRKRDLEDAGFWGKYVIDPDQVCFRTQVAVRSLVAPESVWRSFAEGMDDGNSWDRKVNLKLIALYTDYEMEIDEKIDALKDMGDVGEEFQRDMLIRRWAQIKKMVTDAIQRIEDETT